MTSDRNHGGLLRSKDREIVEAAIEGGYLEQSAGVTVADLAEEFDVSESEARTRLGRGLATLLKTYRSEAGWQGQDVEGLLTEAESCVVRPPSSVRLSPE